MNVPAINELQLATILRQSHDTYKRHIRIAINQLQSVIIYHTKQYWKVYIMKTRSQLVQDYFGETVRKESQ